MWNKDKEGKGEAERREAKYHTEGEKLRNSAFTAGERKLGEEKSG